MTYSQDEILKHLRNHFQEDEGRRMSLEARIFQLEQTVKKLEPLVKTVELIDVPPAS